MSKKRSFIEHNRNIQNRKERPVLLLIAEGKNVTERQYLSQYISTSAFYSIKFGNAGNTTDPVGLYRTAKKEWSKLGLSSKKGDKAVVILDLDCDNQKAEKLATLIKDDKNISFVITNPCFELWFLSHFRYTTKQYQSNEELILELKNHIADYKKTTNVNACLSCRLNDALNNAAKLEKYHVDANHSWPSNESNPRTDVHHLMGMVLKKKNDEA